MVTPKTGRPVGRPRDLERGDAIVGIAWSMFLAQGFEATTIEAIAERAGVSKATLYKLFADKTALFEAGVAREMHMIEAAQTAIGKPSEDATIEDTLRVFGMAIMSFLVSDHAVDFYNSLSGELRRHPKLALAFYEMGPGRTRANLARLLGDAAKKGQIKLDDPDQGADHLFGLWQGFSNFQLSLGVNNDGIRNTLAERVDNGISLFLKGCR